MTSRVAVVVPCFNSSAFIDFFAKDVVFVSKHCDFVFVDDGSSDSSHELLRKLCVERDNCFVVRLLDNAGQSAARNAGVDFVVSNLLGVSHVTFMDIDDSVSYDYFDDFLDLQSDKIYVKGFVSVSSCGSFIIDSHRGIDEFDHITGFDFARMISTWRGTVSACNKIIPVEYLVPFVLDTKEEDTIFTFQIALGNYSFVKSNVGYYRYHRHTTSSTSVIDLRFFDLLYVDNLICRFLNTAGLVEISVAFSNFWWGVVVVDRLSKANQTFYILFSLVLLFKKIRYSLFFVLKVISKAFLKSLRRGFYE